MVEDNSITYLRDENPQVVGSVSTKTLIIEWSEAPWDSAVFDYPVIQINRLVVRGPTNKVDMTKFESVRDELECVLVSCRLPSDNLRESIFLEDQGFRFIEMMYQPELLNLQDCNGLDSAGLIVRCASIDDLPSILHIADTAFQNERFHIDPRINPELGNQRYCNWVKSSLVHDKQELYVVYEKSLLIAFFVTEQLPDETSYWHLNAVDPSLQGRGYGRRSWLAMLELARGKGAKRVRTSVVARNYRVINLYSSLGFRFTSPMMTFHWVRR